MQVICLQAFGWVKELLHGNIEGEHSCIFSQSCRSFHNLVAWNLNVKIIQMKSAENKHHSHFPHLWHVKEIQRSHFILITASYFT